MILALILLLLILLVGILSINLYLQARYKRVVQNFRQISQRYPKFHFDAVKFTSVFNSDNSDLHKWKLKLDEGQYVWVYNDKESSEQSWLEHYYLGSLNSTKNSFPDLLKENGEGKTIRNTLINAVYFVRKLQCSENGHWDGDYSGPHFLLPCAIITSFYLWVKSCTKGLGQESTLTRLNLFHPENQALRHQMKRYIVNSRSFLAPFEVTESDLKERDTFLGMVEKIFNNDNPSQLEAYEKCHGWCWGLHDNRGVQDRPHPYLISTVLYYVCLRLLGMKPDDPYLKATRKSFNRISTYKISPDEGMQLLLPGASSSEISPIMDKKANDDDELEQANNRDAVLSIPTWGKFILTVIGLYDYQGMNSVLPEIWLLPKLLFCHPSKMWCHVRQLYLPFSYCYGAKVALKDIEIPEIIKELRQELYGNIEFADIDWSRYRNKIAPSDVYTSHSNLFKILVAPLSWYEPRKWKWLRGKALDVIYDHVCADDSFTSYMSIAPISSVFNLLVRSTVDGIDSEATLKHLETLKYNLWMGPDGCRLRGTNGSQFWDTAFYVQALIEFLENEDELPEKLKIKEQASHCVKRAVWRYFIDQQTLENNENYEKYYRHPNKGGYPFSTKRNNWILADCTAEALYVLAKIYDILNVSTNHNLYMRKYIESEEALKLDKLRERIYLVVDCLLTFQNSNGGVASYERTRGSKFLELLDPGELFGDIMVEHPYVECTSAFYKGLSKFHAVFPNYRSREIKTALVKALRFVLNQQRDDGSFEGSWGVSFTYATWFALEILTEYSPFKESNMEKVEESQNYKEIERRLKIEIAVIRACKFLSEKQNDDGGWGEDFTSCPLREWIPSLNSNIIQTSWALLGLMNVSYPDELVIKKGIDFLVSKQLPNGDWPVENNTGVFNKTTSIIYSNYKNIFPLWAISRFNKTYHGF